MEEVECDFSKTRIGDKVFSISLGEVTISKNIEGEKRVLIKYRDSTYSRQWDGEVEPNSPFSDLYWSRPTIIAPPSPKRMKKVKIERTILVYRNDGRFDTVTLILDPPPHENEVHRFKIIEEFEVSDE